MISVRINLLYVYRQNCILTFFMNIYWLKTCFGQLLQSYFISFIGLLEIKNVNMMGEFAVQQWAMTGRGTRDFVFQICYVNLAFCAKSIRRTLPCMNRAFNSSYNVQLNSSSNDVKTNFVANRSCKMSKVAMVFWVKFAANHENLHTRKFRIFLGKIAFTSRSVIHFPNAPIELVEQYEIFVKLLYPNTWTFSFLVFAFST